MISEMLYKALFGALGSSLTVYALYNSHHIIENFREQEDVAISMFLLNDRAADNFRMLAYISILYSVMALLVVAGLVPDTYPYDVAVLSLFGGLAYFLREIRELTSGAGS